MPSRTSENGVPSVLMKPGISVSRASTKVAVSSPCSLMTGRSWASRRRAEHALVDGRRCGNVDGEWGELQHLEPRGLEARSAAADHPLIGHEVLGHRGVDVGAALEHRHAPQRTGGCLRIDEPGQPARELGRRRHGGGRGATPPLWTTSAASLALRAAAGGATPRLVGHGLVLLVQGLVAHGPQPLKMVPGPSRTAPADTRTRLHEPTAREAGTHGLDGQLVAEE